MEAALSEVDKRRRIYGADRGVMEPDCDHGAALATSQCRIIDIVMKCVVGTPILRSSF